MDYRRNIFAPIIDWLPGCYCSSLSFLLLLLLLLKSKPLRNSKHVLADDKRESSTTSTRSTITPIRTFSPSENGKLLSIALSIPFQFHSIVHCDALPNDLAYALRQVIGWISRWTCIVGTDEQLIFRCGSRWCRPRRWNEQASAAQTHTQKTTPKLPQNS